MADEQAVRESEMLFRGAHRNSQDPDQAINRAITEHQAGLKDWTVLGEFDLAREHRRAMQWVGWYFEDGLLPQEWKEVRVELPRHPRITFEPRDPRGLGSYWFGRNVADGLRWRIDLNPNSILKYERSPAQTASVLLHEMLHLVEDVYRQAKNKTASGGSYHSTEFRRHAEQRGIPCTINGAELGITEGGIFQKWLIRRDVPGAFEYADDSYRDAPVLPKRIKWSCRCEDSVAVLVPRASAIQAICQRCESPYTPTSLSDSRKPGAKHPRITRKDKP